MIYHIINNQKAFCPQSLLSGMGEPEKGGAGYADSQEGERHL
jgi:hypothetical protein